MVAGCTRRGFCYARARMCGKPCVTMQPATKHIYVTDFVTELLVANSLHGLKGCNRNKQFGLELVA